MIPDINYKRQVKASKAPLVTSDINVIHNMRQVLKLKDGGEVGLDWLDDPTDKRVADADYDGPIVLFLPGLTGHSQSEYIKSFINVAHKVKKSHLLPRTH